FGIVSRRAVLLDALTVVQNLAMPYTLEVEPPSAEVRAQAIALAEEVGLAASTHDRPIAELDGAGRFRARLARAVALDPAVLLFEHPTAEVEHDDIDALAVQCRTVAAGRGIAAIVLTAEREFADASASRVLTLEPATGRLVRRSWLSRLRLG